MICSKCGKEIPDDAKFCGACGKVLTSSGSDRTTCPMDLSDAPDSFRDELVKEKTKINTPAFETERATSRLKVSTPKETKRVALSYSEATKYMRNISQTAKGIINAPLFTIAVICAVIAFACNMIGWFNKTPLDEAVAAAMNFIPADLLGDTVHEMCSNALSWLSGLLTDYELVKLVLNLVWSIPVILEIIGLIILLIYCRTSCATTGIGLVKSGVVISIVYAAFISVFSVIASLFGIVAGALMGQQELVAAIAVLTIVTALITATITYLASLMTALSIAEDAIIENAYDQRPSRYIAVVNFLIATLSFSALVAYDFYDGNTLKIVSSLCSVLAHFLFGIVIFQSCKLEAVNKAHYEITAATKKSDVSVVKKTEAVHFCGECGKALHEGESCSCKKTFTPSDGKTVKPPTVSAVTPKKTVSGGLKSTMRTHADSEEKI